MQHTEGRDSFSGQRRPAAADMAGGREGPGGLCGGPPESWRGPERGRKGGLLPFKACPFAGLEDFSSLFLVNITKCKKIFARKNNFFARILPALCQFLKKTAFPVTIERFHLKSKRG